MQKALASVPGVRNASVNFESGEAEVTYDPNEVSVDELTAAVGDAGGKFSASVKE